MTDTTEVGNQLRLDLLREALPYIQRFKGKTFVVKCSGKVTEDHESLISLAEELALVHQGQAVALSSGSRISARRLFSGRGRRGKSFQYQRRHYRFCDRDSTQS